MSSAKSSAELLDRTPAASGSSRTYVHRNNEQNQRQREALLVVRPPGVHLNQVALAPFELSHGR